MLSESEHSLMVGDDERYSPPLHQVRKEVAFRETLETLVPKMYIRHQRQRDKVAPAGNDVSTQKTLDFISEYLDVRYNVIGNDGGRFHVDLVLTNSGNRMIPSCCWSIYFYHMKYEHDLPLLFISAVSLYCYRVCMVQY